MMGKYAALIATELNIDTQSAANTLKLLAEGATIPFISRYRKEATGSLDEEQVGYIQERSEKLKELDKRRGAILASIDEQGKLSEELRIKLESATTG